MGLMRWGWIWNGCVIYVRCVECGLVRGGCDDRVDG